MKLIRLLPVDELKIANAKAVKSETIPVEQRNARGMTEGHCSLSVYAGTPLFSVVGGDWQFA